MAAADPKHPLVAALAAVAMENLNAQNARQLADKLNWNGHDAARDANRLVSGETDARLSSLVDLMLKGELLAPKAARALEAAIRKQEAQRLEAGTAKVTEVQLRAARIQGSSGRRRARK